MAGCVKNNGWLGCIKFTEDVVGCDGTVTCITINKATEFCLTTIGELLYMGKIVLGLSY